MPVELIEPAFQGQSVKLVPAGCYLVQAVADQDLNLQGLPLGGRMRWMDSRVIHDSPPAFIFRAGVGWNRSLRSTGDTCEEVATPVKTIPIVTRLDTLIALAPVSWQVHTNPIHL